MAIISAIMTVNTPAVLLALISHIIIGAIWFHPAIFGNDWIKLSGMEMKPAVKWVPVDIVAHLICTIALAVFINLSNATTVLEGLIIGNIIAIGFVGTTMAGELVWEKIPFKLFLIRLGDQIISFSIAGIILSLWK